MGIDHTSVYVPEDKFKECLAFYTEALKPLSYEVRIPVNDTVVGLGSSEDSPHGADFWLIGVKHVPNQSSHVAFRAKDRDTVHRFHAQAVAAGGKCNGPPGPRPIYGPAYYGGFALDPAGNNIEAVCFKPE